MEVIENNVASEDFYDEFLKKHFQCIAGGENVIHQIRNEAADLIPIHKKLYNRALEEYREKFHTVYGSSEALARVNGLHPPRIEYFSKQEDASFFMWRMLSIVSEPEAYNIETWKYYRCCRGSCKRLRAFTIFLDCEDVTPDINECQFDNQSRKSLKNILFIYTNSLFFSSLI